MKKALSRRAANVLLNLKYERKPGSGPLDMEFTEISDEVLREKIMSGKIDLKKKRGFGEKTGKEIFEYLKIPESFFPTKKKWNFDPWTGKPINKP
jgi:hypothetical protein